MKTRQWIVIAGAVLAVVSLLLLAGCSCRHCSTERERALLERGEPLDRDLERDGTLFTETWHYWQNEETVVFFWDERECSCEMSIYEVDGSRVSAELDFNTSRSTPFAP